MKLEGKGAFVTGGASGLGAAIARAFAREGARVCVGDIDERGARAVAEECDAITRGSVAVACDVTDSASVAEAFVFFRRGLGQLDVLVNNAGIIHTDPVYVEAIADTSKAQINEVLSGQPVSSHFRAIEMTSDSMLERMFRVHVFGTFYCTREALPIMREQGKGGRIINMGSIMGSASLAGAPDYCAAKGAILAFTRSTAREAVSYGVQVNAIAPGFIDTPLLDPLDEEQKKIIAMQTPMLRLGTAEEVASVAVFLAGDDSSYFTGQVLSPNGGIYMSQ
ncbi:MAG: SDR family NAD(P)-dependent oxidoreductase [Candidatus Binatia bacterium]